VRETVLAKEQNVLQLLIPNPKTHCRFLPEEKKNFNHICCQRLLWRYFEIQSPVSERFLLLETLFPNIRFLVLNS
jgi:hypothetical protein